MNVKKSIIARLLKKHFNANTIVFCEYDTIGVYNNDGCLWYGNTKDAIRMLRNAR